MHQNTAYLIHGRAITSSLSFLSLQHCWETRSKRGFGSVRPPYLEVHLHSKLLAGYWCSSHAMAALVQSPSSAIDDAGKAIVFSCELIFMVLFKSDSVLQWVLIRDRIYSSLLHSGKTICSFTISKCKILYNKKPWHKTARVQLNKFQNNDILCIYIIGISV